MGLYIRDDLVRDMAKRLAQARHTTVTEAVRRAISASLRRWSRTCGRATAAFARAGAARCHAAAS